MDIDPSRVPFDQPLVARRRSPSIRRAGQEQDENDIDNAFTASARRCERMVEIQFKSVHGRPLQNMNCRAAVLVC
jgi:hypothetical protein